MLLILAGVSIAMLTGENGILKQVQNSKESTEQAEEDEKIKLDIYDRYIDNATSGETKEVFIKYYGKKVNYVSQKEKTEGIKLTWRIFYDDSNYVYLISSKEDGSNTIEELSLSDYISEYPTGSDAVPEELRYLNSKWYEVLGSTPSTNDNAKAVAYLMDQTVWGEYKDSEGKASYAIGSPTIELFSNSYNAIAEEYSRPYRINAVDECSEIGYPTILSEGWLPADYNNGIYNNGGTSLYWWLASPSDHIYATFMYGVEGEDYDGLIGFSAEISGGLRPIVIIPKANFNYQIEA